MKKKLLIIQVIIAVIIVLLISTVALYNFKMIKIPFLKDINSTKISEQTTTMEDMQSYYEQRQKVTSVRATTIDFSGTLPKADTIKNKLELNSVILKINPFDLFLNSTVTLFSEESPKLIRLRSYLEELKAFDIKAYIKMDVKNTGTLNYKNFLLKSILGENNNLRSAELSTNFTEIFISKLNSLNIDGVIFENATKDNLKTVTAISKSLKDNQKIVSAVSPSDEVLENAKWLDFVEVELEADSKEDIDSFSKKAEEIAKDMSQKGFCILINHKQINNKNTPIYSLATTFDAVQNIENHVGSVFNLSTLLNRPNVLSALKLRFKEVIDFSVANKELFITAPDKNITVNSPNYSIYGICDNNFPLTMNGNLITPTDRGVFGVDVVLKQGENKFNFEHKGITKTVVINYDINPIKSISPSSNISISSGSELTLSVVAMPGATVNGKIGTTSLKFTQTADMSDNDNSESKDSSYVIYTAKYKAPQVDMGKTVVIGTFTATASIRGVTKSISGGKISVYEKWNIEPSSESPTSSSGTAMPPQNGSVSEGVKYLAVINSDFAEMYSQNPKKTNLSVSTAEFGFCPKGVKDYIVGEAFAGEYEFYKLYSGIMVEQKYVDVVETNENILSDVTAITAKQAGKFTDITFTGSKGNIFTTWYNVPFTGTLYDCIFNTSSISFDIANVSSSVNANLQSPAFTSTSMIKVSENRYRFSINLRTAGRLYGHTAYTNENGELVLRIKNPVFAENGRLDNFKILIDPGHEGSYNKTPVFGTSEAAMNLDVALMLKSNYQSLGANVEMIRENSVQENDREATQRKLMTGDYDFFISIHHNATSGKTTTASGPTAYYFYPFSQVISNEIANGLLSTGLYPNRTAKSISYGNYLVIRSHSTLCTLAEIGFYTNVNELQMLINKANQKKFADVISASTVNYFK